MSAKSTPQTSAGKLRRWLLPALALAALQASSSGTVRPVQAQQRAHFSKWSHPEDYPGDARWFKGYGMMVYLRSNLEVRSHRQSVPDGLLGEIWLRPISGEDFLLVISRYTQTNCSPQKERLFEEQRRLFKDQFQFHTNSGSAYRANNDASYVDKSYYPNFLCESFERYDEDPPYRYGSLCLECNEQDLILMTLLHTENRRISWVDATLEIADLMYIE